MAEVAEIIPKLVDRTDQNRINWRQTPSEGTFGANIGSWSVTISTTRVTLGVAFGLRVYDQEGKFLDEVRASTGTELHRSLSQLHEKAKRSALGIDRQLEGLMAELDKV